MNGVLKIGVLASTNGTDLASLIKFEKEGKLDARIALVLCNKECPAADKGRKAGIEALVVESKGKTREEFDELVAKELEKRGIELIVLIGYMRLLSTPFVRKYANKIINIHPSLLPDFPGMDLDVHSAVIKNGRKTSGCTLHFVDEGTDTGPIIIQKTVEVANDETPESLKKKIQPLEAIALLEGINAFSQGKIRVEGRKVLLSDANTSAVLLDGRKLSEKCLEESRKKLEKILVKEKPPVLQVILVGDDAASKVYVKMKKKACEKTGIAANIHHLGGNTSEKELIELVEEFNSDEKTTGLMIQLPLPKHIDTRRVLEKIRLEKDVDGLNPANLAKKFEKPGFVPATAKAVMRLIEETGVVLEGKNAAVMGRSVEVGVPVRELLVKKKCVVTTVHSKTENPKLATGSADILVVAIGRPNLVDASFVKSGAVVIDVGINKLDGKLVGDVDFNSVEKKAGFITPVPGGVGPMTISMLVENVVEAYENSLQNGLKA
ncbi:phosphoribosylglycinamide formyltransferase [Candidatus Micrarchaeota archaeon]|nr:phosphoribosylglycinamide formyltransferase [Candidatus Micrarchaeota archaeon]